MVATMAGVARLADPAAFAGYAGDPADPSSMLLRHHGLHLEMVIDRAGPIGATDPAGRPGRAGSRPPSPRSSTSRTRSRPWTRTDKTAAYRNWLGLNTGDAVGRGRRRTAQSSPAAWTPTAPTPTRTGRPFILPGRSLLLVRNVGHHMTTDAVLDAAGARGLRGHPRRHRHRRRRAARAARRGAPGATAGPGSVYIVKPKMHGPDEVAFTVDLFGRVEALLELGP